MPRQRRIPRTSYSLSISQQTAACGGLRRSRLRPSGGRHRSAPEKGSVALKRMSSTTTSLSLQNPRHALERWVERCSALDTRLERRVAINASRRFESDEARKRFREGSSRRLPVQHPISSASSILANTTTAFIVMSTGRPRFGDDSERGVPLVASRLFEGSAPHLAHAHGTDYSRDIKPGNLILALRRPQRACFGLPVTGRPSRSGAAVAAKLHARNALGEPVARRRVRVARRSTSYYVSFGVPVGARSDAQNPVLTALPPSRSAPDVDPALARILVRSL